MRRKGDRGSAGRPSSRCASAMVVASPSNVRISPPPLSLVFRRSSLSPPTRSHQQPRTPPPPTPSRSRLAVSLRLNHSRRLLLSSAKKRRTRPRSHQHRFNRYIPVAKRSSDRILALRQPLPRQNLGSDPSAIDVRPLPLLLTHRRAAVVRLRWPSDSSERGTVCSSGSALGIRRMSQRPRLSPARETRERVRKVGG